MALRVNRMVASCGAQRAGRATKLDEPRAGRARSTRVLFCVCRLNAEQCGEQTLFRRDSNENATLEDMPRERQNHTRIDRNPMKNQLKIDAKTMKNRSGGLRSVSDRFGDAPATLRDALGTRRERTKSALGALSGALGALREGPGPPGEDRKRPRDGSAALRNAV